MKAQSEPNTVSHQHDASREEPEPNTGSPQELREETTEHEPPSPSPVGGHTRRVVSLDAFRGGTVLLMLLVNNVALDSATPDQLQHAPWNQGVHLADMVFPWFLLCVGLAIPFAAASFQRKGLPEWRYELKILYRSAALVLLGCLISSSLLRRPVFVLGVLQMIGLAYLVGALLYDLPLLRRLLIAGALLAAYGAAIKYVPVPGVGAGVVREDSNLVLHINRTFLSPVSLYGLPSVIPTSALVLIGTALGDLLRRREMKPLRITGALLASGLVLAVIGAFWSREVAYNKAIWTPSYILLTAGIGTFILGVFYYLSDTLGWRKWSYPLVVPGANAILAYIGPILFKLWVLQVWQVRVGRHGTLSLQDAILGFFVRQAGRVAGGWIYTLTYIGAWWFVLWLLHRRGLYLRV